VKIKSRQQLLIIGVIVVAAFFAGDKVILTPLGNLWTARSKQIAELKKRVESGAQLIQREQSLHNRWNQMRTNTLPVNPSRAEQQLLRAFDRWSQDSKISITSLSPQWKHDSDDFMTLQCRVEAAGNMGAVSRFLYDVEKDPMALRLEIVEVSSRDAEGQQLALGLQVSGLVLTPQEKRP
jgi:hypothetical protein